MKIIASYIVSFLIQLSLFGQTGTSVDPYTNLGQAWFVPSNGTYHFNINGTIFSSYVEAGNGWILIASGNATTSESSYGITNALTLQSDAILSSSIYTSSLVTDVRINATSGPSLTFDVQSSDAGVLSNLQNNTTLSVGTNNTDWTGTGTANLQRNCASNSEPLSTHIYHSCGLPNLHWQVGRKTGHEKIELSNAQKNDLNLWVRATPVPLPIELLNFDASFNQSTVQLTWQTASEVNNDFFTIERSSDNLLWEEVSTVAGAGNSSTLLVYETVDYQTITGISYYRLKQTDFDGSFNYSSIVSINTDIDFNTSNVIIYPNPAYKEINIIGTAVELAEIKVLNLIGQDISILTSSIDINGEKVSVDLSQLNPGIYYIKTKNTATTIQKN